MNRNEIDAMNIGLLLGIATKGIIYKGKDDGSQPEKEYIGLFNINKLRESSVIKVDEPTRTGFSEVLNRIQTNISKFGIGNLSESITVE